ncbi:outer membrane beta-barrel protein, partial [Longimicrobium sp.]|uniref:outer membrane beta-barrel protein n=1 Tax=Longimicrobium sp. TaxID=2029185 RepID=UPI002F94A855
EDGGSEAERGIGAGVKLGFGVSDQVTIFVRGDFASVSYAKEVAELDADPYTLASIDLAGRYSFGAGPVPLRPYAELGLSGTAIHDKLNIEDDIYYDATYSGAGLLVGFGLEYFLNRNVALDAGLLLGKGRLTNFEIDGEPFDRTEDLDYTTVRMNLGFVFRP